MSGFKIKVPVFLIPDGEYATAYCPFLELSGYGVNEEDAMQSFEHCMDIFLEDAAERGNLHDLLTQLGWALIEDDGRIFEPPVVPRHFLPRTISKNRVFDIPAIA